MADIRYKRVNRARPCLICGKPDWCSRTADDSISFCARVSQGADRLSRKEQWGVFYHDTEKLNQPQTKRHEHRNHQRIAKPEIKAAPLEIRDFVYNTLFRLSPASNFQSLTQGVKGLFERGLKHSEDYGALPCSINERKKLAAQIRVLLNRNFPSFVCQNPHGISHIPGFWLDDSGKARLWFDKDYHHPMLLIPYRNPFGKIQACQIRFFGADNHNQNRYLWLSLPSLGSAGSGTPLHFANRSVFGKNDMNFSVIVTEGALKADTIVNFFPQHLIIANSGVSCAHELIASTSLGRKVLVAFDNDYFNNPAVVRQLAKLIFTVSVDKSFPTVQNKVSILSWNHKFKGIDDALLSNSPICEVGLNVWLSLLSLENREIFYQISKLSN